MQVWRRVIQVMKATESKERETPFVIGVVEGQKPTLDARRSDGDVMLGTRIQKRLP
jgi:hypothetical protein